jgi:putative transposase
MSRKCCSPDNAACEGFFGQLKIELFYTRNWQTTTIEQFIQVVDSNIRWYNENESKSPLAHAVPSNAGIASLSRHKPVQVLRRIQSGKF